MATAQSRVSFLRHYVLGELQFGGWGLVERGVSALNALIVLSALSLYEYGVFQLLLAAFGFAIGLPSLMMTFADNDVSRFIGEGREREAKRAFLEFYGLRCVATLLLAVLFFFGSNLFIQKYGSEVARFGKILALLMAVDVLQRLCTSLLNFRLRFAAIARRRVVQKTLQLLFLGAFVVSASKVDVRVVLWSLVVGSLGMGVTMVPSAIRAYTPWRGLKAVRRWILPRTFKAYGKWASAQGLLGHVTEQVEPWLIKIFVSTEAVALFVVARSLIAVVTNFVPTRTLGTLLPMRVYDSRWSRRVFLRGVKYQVAFTFLGVLAGAAVFPFAVRLFFPKYVVALPYFYALAGTAPIAAIGSLPVFFLRAMRRQRFLFFNRVVKTAVALPLTLIFLPLLGLWGLVLERWLQLLVKATVLVLYLKRSAPEFALHVRDLTHFGKEDADFAREALRIGVRAARPY
ncbi:MAG: oligosaccharide flippase family protein, partial [Patescibacteria group bacterium]|nr:oligosaccharide flippase family protein [Patescibacteria group bacterium]